MVTVGVVGIGDWGKNLVRCFNDLSDVDYCCHTGTTSNARWVADRFSDVTLTRDVGQILHDDAVDALVIATPVGTHHQLARRALQADKHVFVEKPLAEDGESAHELISLASDQGLKLFTGYVFLYAPAMRALFERTRRDSPVAISARWEKFGSFDATIGETLACHDIAIGHRLFREEFNHVSEPFQVGVRTEGDILDATFRTTDRRTMTVSYDRTANRKRKSVVVVTKSGARYEFVNDRLIELNHNDHRDITPADPAEPLTNEVGSFLEWVEGGETPPTGGVFGASVSDVLDLLSQ